MAKEILVETHSEKHVSDFENRRAKYREARISQNKTSLGCIGHVDGDSCLTTHSHDAFLRATAT